MADGQPLGLHAHVVPKSMPVGVSHVEPIPICIHNGWPSWKMEKMRVYQLKPAELKLVEPLEPQCHAFELTRTGGDGGDGGSPAAQWHSRE